MELDASPFSLPSSGEDRLAACLTFPHRAEAFFGALHRQNDTDLWFDPGLGNQAHHVLHVFKRAHDRTGDGELVGKHWKEIQSHIEPCRAAKRNQRAATSE